MSNKKEITIFFQNLQDNICDQLAAADGVGKFQQDLWERKGGGGGRTRVFLGKHIEKGGVNFSAVEGNLPEKISKALKIDTGEFYATGVSIVLHPKNPHVPIIHMNVRYFEMSDGRWWFGGGIDVTPHYVVEEDAKFFHQYLKTICDEHHESYYPEFKKWADDYFYIKHRDETRGIGGIFFDRLSKQNGFEKRERFDFVKSVGNAFCPIYLNLLHKNKGKEFTKEQQNWQSIRRGRYVEFNLVWDKGTKFGLDTNGRTESILMSMPPLANWKYNYKVEEGSEEDKTQKLLKKEIEWVV